MWLKQSPNGGILRPRFARSRESSSPFLHFLSSALFLHPLCHKTLAHWGRWGWGGWGGQRGESSIHLAHTCFSFPSSSLLTGRTQASEEAQPHIEPLEIFYRDSEHTKNRAVPRLTWSIQLYVFSSSSSVVLWRSFSRSALNCSWETAAQLAEEVSSWCFKCFGETNLWSL